MFLQNLCACSNHKLYSNQATFESFPEDCCGVSHIQRISLAKRDIGLWLAPSSLVVRVDVSTSRPVPVELTGLLVVQLLPPVGVADEWEDPRAQLRVVRKRGDGLVLVGSVLLRDRKDVEPNPDFAVAVNAEVSLDILQPAQLGPFVVVWVIIRLPILGHEVGRRAVGHLERGVLEFIPLIIGKFPLFVFTFAFGSRGTVSNANFIHVG